MRATLQRHERLLLYLAVFLSGMTTLAVEVSASRLLGSVFGTSNLVWTNIIGLILLYLALGYFIGGRFADRRPSYAWFYGLITLSAFTCALIPLLSRPILSIASRAVVEARAGLALGSFLTVLILFALPVTLLGMISPFSVKLAVSNVDEAGRIVGRLYAVGTLGSLLGTFLPTLVLIPWLGTTETFLTFSAVLFLIGLVGLWTYRGNQAAIALLTLPLLAFSLPLRGQSLHSAYSDDFTVLFEDESAYNYIQVQEDVNGYRYLFLNEGQGIHSQWHPTQIVYNRTWSYFLNAPYFNAPPFTPSDVQSIAVIGLAAGTIPRQHIAIYGDIPIDGVEIDPEIVQVGADYFQMNAEFMPSLTVYVQDGRYVLNQLERPYTLIAIDAYRPPYIPWHLTTVEFFAEVREHLSENGVVAINVGRTNTDRRLVDALTVTLQAVYPSVHTLDVPQTFNTILVASRQPTDAQNLQANLANLPTDANPLLRDVLTRGVQSIVPTATTGTLFTDNHAPVEWLVDSLVVNFLLSEDLEQIR
ncbi:MAG: spermidine synthase [Phototrophicaceae bacterium]